jgi:hypothetical protein
MAGKTTLRGTRTKLTTSVADLGSVVRLDPIHNNSFSFSFVLDEALQLKEAPITKNPIHPLSFSLFPDSFQVFHNNLVSIKVGNNVFTYTMVYVLHPTSFPTTKLFEQSLSRPCAFRLKLGTQIFELLFSSLDFSRIIKPTVTTDGEVVYSEVNAQNNVLRTVVLLSGSNLFRECEQEETSTFFIHPEKALSNIPTEVFLVAVRDSEFELLPTLEQSQYQSIFFNVCTSWEIVSDRCSFDSWLGFSLLDHSTSLSHTSDCYLSRKFETLSNCMVDSIMEFKVLSDFMLPSIINTELQGFSVSFDSGNYFKGWIDSNFCSHNSSHKDSKVVDIFKSFGNKEERAFLPWLKPWVSCPEIL